ncbi:MAG: CoA ester lyase [Rhodobacter sp.]|nr:CoA ester lyase [Rhodobacter sp.]MCY4242369.1 CoA ester lyase [Rhodobacter sp.]
MNISDRPFRSVLYVPGSRERALDKARELRVDAVIMDLEDAVAPDRKSRARELVVDTLNAGGYGNRTIIVRVNGLDTRWGPDDVAAMENAGADAVLLPKVESAANVDEVAETVNSIDLWAMIETPSGVIHASEIAAHPRLKGFILGTNDLARCLNSRPRPDRTPLLASLQFALLAARAHHVICVDGVYNAFRDEEGLRAECVQGRDMGYDGKTLIHPAQVAIANEVFAPTAEEVSLAKRRIEAFETAEASGEGVAVVDGSIVENLHVETDRALLARAETISALENAK